MLDILQIDRGSNVMLFRNLRAKNGDGPPLPMVIDRTKAPGRLLVSGPLNAVMREARRHSPKSQEFDHPGSPSLQLTSP